MTHEPRTVTNAALDKLPLFATDLEIAIAIVGKMRPANQGVGAWGDLAGYPEYRKAEAEEERLPIQK
ncbi:hypothetical protein OOJ09_18905 [Mesorhizobium qingshengii]|uniref:Uncharacterized protein n=1 Tax=Mesorhizobium qingshengii TaxID=1165689 RepID=A0ABT4QXH0_9HYPH|nr:hypothetical protein [Mesorhizobium qingshengii]MCZ8546263.1 hypothetical protein [Mesorhizobium qingshengii]